MNWVSGSCYFLDVAFPFPWISCSSTIPQNPEFKLQVEVYSLDPRSTVGALVIRIGCWGFLIIVIV